MRILFDIESNGLLDTVSVIHCICTVDIDTGEEKHFDNNSIDKGILYLQQADTLVGHNIICFDLPCIKKVFGVDLTVDKEIIDTLVLSRLVYSNLPLLDSGLVRSGKLPMKLRGSHSLKAWGYRLDNNKGTFAEDNGENCWDTYTVEMFEYCKQDIRLNKNILDKLVKHNYSKVAIELEHQIATEMFLMEQNGFSFDIKKAQELEMILRAEKANADQELFKIIPQIPDKIFIPKRDNKRLGHIAGVPIQRYKDFNPNSRQQLEYVVKTIYKYSTDNIELYDTEDIDISELSVEEIGNLRLKMDEVTFNYIANDENADEELRRLAGVMSKSLLLSKRLGQLCDGAQAWTKNYNETTGKIHGRVNPNGAVTGRATHNSPNIAQVPSIDSEYGRECRELFKAPEGWYQVGVDASGLELRCLAHFMSPYDNGEYAHEILNGDIHTKNQKNAGLPTRNNAKTFIYAFL